MAGNVFDQFDAHGKGAAPNVFDQFDPGYNKPEESGDFMRGAKVALGQTVPIAKGLVGLAGATAENVFGEGGISTGIKNWGLRGYQEGMQKLAPLQKDTDELTTAWDRAKQGDLGALVDWAQYGLGYAVGQGGEALATSLLGAVAGAAVAPEAAPVAAAGGAITGLVAKGAVKEAATSLIEKAVLKEANRLMAESGGKLAAEQATKEATKSIAKNIGSTSALLAYGGAQELGSIYPEAEAEALKKGEKLDGGDLARIWATGLAAGGLEGLTDRLGVNAALGKIKIPGVGGRVSNAALQGLGGAVVEGGTEAAQTAIERYGAGQDITSDEGIKDIINSAGLGAIGGGGIGAGAGLLHGKAQPAAQPQAPAEPPAPTLQLGNTPDPFIVFPDGTTGKRSDLEAYINGLPEDQRIAVRAKLLGMGEQQAPAVAAPAVPGPLDFDAGANYLPEPPKSELTTSLGAAPDKAAGGVDFEPISAIMSAGSVDDAIRLAEKSTKPSEYLPDGPTMEQRLGFMAADADRARTKEADLDRIQQQAAEQDLINAALARAAEAPALTPMQLALQRAREAKALAEMPAPAPVVAPLPEPKPAPAATELPRIVPRGDLFPLSKVGAQRRQAQQGGEIVRVQTAAGKMAYAVIPEGSQPQPVTANEQDQAAPARGNEAQAQPQAPVAAEAAAPEARDAGAGDRAPAGGGTQADGLTKAVKAIQTSDMTTAEKIRLAHDVQNGAVAPEAVTAILGEQEPNAIRDAGRTAGPGASDAGAVRGTERALSGAAQERVAAEPVPSPEQGVGARDDGRGRDGALTPTNSLAKTASWVIKERATGKVVMETFDKAKVDALNTAKYEAVPILEHLQSLNGKPQDEVPAGPRILARIGRTPNSATAIELQPNADGTLTPVMEGAEMLDFESGEPIKLPAKVTDDEAKAAIRKAGAVSNKQNFYAPKDTKLSAVDDATEAEQNPADEPADDTDTSREGEAGADPRDQRDAAAFSGRLERGGFTSVLKATRADPQRADQRAAEVIASKLFKKRIVWVEFDGKPIFNGARFSGTPDVIYLWVGSKKPAQAVVGHELLHSLRGDNPALYDDLVARLKPQLQNENGFRAELARKDPRAARDMDETMEELVADIVGDNFTEPEFWADLGKGRSEGFQKLLAAVRKFLDRIIMRVTLLRPFGSELYLRDLKQARDAVADAVRAYSDQRTREQSAGDDFKFSATTPEDQKLSRPASAILGAADAAQKIIGAEPKMVGETTRKYTARQAKAMERVGFGAKPPTASERIKAIWQDAGKKLAQGLADQFAPVKELSQEAYGLLRLSKGASGAFEAMLQGGRLKLTDGVYDFDDTKRGGVIDKLLKPLGGEHHDFFRWVAANRAEKLAAEGRENLFTPEDIAAIKTLQDGTTSFDYTIQHGIRKGQTTRDRTLIYADSLKTFNEFQNNVLDMAEQSGLIDPEARKLWQSEFYVPFYRVTEDSGVASMNIKGGVVRQQAFQKLKGGKDQLNADLLDNTLMNWAHLLDAAAKNRAAKATLEAAERMGKAIPAGESTAREMGSSIDRKNGVVWFMDHGLKRYYLVDDPYLLTAINALEYAGMKGPAMQAMSAFKHVLTVGVTASPFFKVRNLIRDSVQVIGTSGISTNAAKNIGEGWKLTNPKSDAYFRLLAGGGMIHFGTMYEGAEARRVQQLVESGVDAGTILNTENKVKAFYKKVIKPGIDAYNELGSRGEAINRASLYKQLREQGMSHADASLQARDLMDFSLQGSFSSIRFLSQVVPFLNARIQGLYKLGRAAKEDPARFSAVIGAATVASLTLLMAFGDDEDWKKREEWDRDNYWWFKLGGTAYRIPKPFEIGAVATLAERGFEYAFDKEMDGKRFRERVLSLLGSNLSMNPIPQLVKPALDVYANVDSFSGRPIESEAMKKLKPEYRFNNNTSMTARAISTAANAVTGTIGAQGPSPVQVDQLLRGYFGWLGSFVVTAGDILARPATGQTEKASPDYWKSATGGMVANLEDAPSRYVSQMYTQAREIEEAYATWRSLLKSGNVEEAKEFREDNAATIAKYRAVESIKRRESQLSARIKQIEESNQSSDTKRDLIRSLNALKDSTARQLARLS